MVEQKRQGGRTTKKDGEDIWLVLTESEGKEGVGFTHSCGEEIQGTSVASPIWDGPFRMSGSGRVHTQTVPFCPKCETPPDYHGAPIDVPYPGVANKF